MDAEGFRQFLCESHLGDRTIKNYCDYVAKFESCFRVNADKIVQSDETMADLLSRMNEFKDVSENSYSSYATGLRMYYVYRNRRQYVGVTIRTDRPAPVVNETHWYQEVKVADIDAWWRFVRELNNGDNGSIVDSHHWAFRGQGDAAWGLESSLGRMAGYGENDQNDIGSRLVGYEQESMWIFRREACKRFEYRNLSECELLALMQHYGCKTRLLDFTMAPLVALYMAVEQGENLQAQVKGYANSHPTILKKEIVFPSLAFWAVNLNEIAKGSESEPGHRWKTVDELTSRAERILKGGKNKNPGVLPLFPKICNDRISAQDGLFLMPLSLGNSFEENLQITLGDATYPASELKNTINKPSATVYKFVIDSRLFRDVKRLLRDANVTAKYMYPDLTGLGRFVSAEIMRHFDSN